MDRQSLAIATMCWARDQDEEELLRQSLSELSLLGLPVFITDGGSGEDFINFISSLKHFKVFKPTKKTLWAQVVTSLKNASNCGGAFTLYTEPDKFDFFKQLPEMVNHLKLNQETGVVIASRSEAGMKSFPTFQQMTETTINNCCAELIGQAIDYTYGPFILNNQLISYLNTLPDDIGWGWRPFAFNIACRLNLKIESYVDDFFCPDEQREDDKVERLYRMKQLTQNIEGLTLSTSAVLK